MPIYEYRCASCGHELEALQKLTDAQLVDCPACHKPELRKLVSAAGFKLKGSGWYVTDFRNGSGKRATKSGDDRKDGANESAAGKDSPVKSGDATPAGSASGDAGSGSATTTSGSSKASESAPAKAPASTPSDGGS